jgi:hypothetical protein
MHARRVCWKPVWHIREGHFALILVNAAHVNAVPGRKSDVNDATWLANLLAHWPHPGKLCAAESATSVIVLKSARRIAARTSVSRESRPSCGSFSAPRRCQQSKPDRRERKGSGAFPPSSSARASGPDGVLRTSSPHPNTIHNH